jgi:cytochrome c556
MALAVGGSLAASQTPYPLFTLEDFIKLMKSVGANWDGTSASIAKGDFEEAKSRLTRSREQLAVTITFWRDNKKADAVKMLRHTLTKLDELDAALSVDRVEAAAATLVKPVNEACEACHAVYRDQDPATNAYRLKPGSVPGH